MGSPSRGGSPNALYLIIWSRETGSVVVPSRVSLLISIVRLNHTVDPMLLPSGNPFKCHEEVLYLQPMIPPTKRFDTFPPDWGMLRRSRCVQIFLSDFSLKSIFEDKDSKQLSQALGCLQ